MGEGYWLPLRLRCSGIGSCSARLDLAFSTMEWRRFCSSMERELVIAFSWTGFTFSSSICYMVLFAGGSTCEDSGESDVWILFV